MPVRKLIERLAPAPPPGLTVPGRTAGPSVPEFRKVTSSIFLHARVRVAPPPNNSASLRRRNQLAALLNYQCNTPPRLAANQRRRPDSSQCRRPATPRVCARGNELTQHSRLAATLRVVDRVRARVGPGAAKVVQIRKSVNL